MNYKNRHGDIYTFTKTEKGIEWTGDFKYHRIGYPNNYKDAYDAYKADGGDLPMKDFVKEVHMYHEGNYQPSEVNSKYSKMIFSERDQIEMVDPSGGPYISRGSNLGNISEEFEGMIVKDFEKIKKGYLIILEDEKN